MKVPLIGIILLTLILGACSSSATETAVTEPTTTQPTSAPTAAPPTEVPVPTVVVPVAGEPCSYLAREEVEAFVGQRFEALTVTGESCIWSFATLSSGTFAGERPTLRLGVLTGSDEFDSLRSEIETDAATEIPDLGDAAFVRAGDGVNGGETYVLEGNTTIVVAFQLTFAQSADQAAAQQRVAELVLSRL